jgi:hypothetical protein
MAGVSGRAPRPRLECQLVTGTYYCPKCGTARQPDMRSCASCGYNFGNAGEAGAESTDDPRAAANDSQPFSRPVGRRRSLGLAAVLGATIVGALALVWILLPKDGLTDDEREALLNSGTAKCNGGGGGLH